VGRDEQIQSGVDAVSVGSAGIGDGAWNGGEGGFVEGDFDAVAGLFAVSGLGQVAFDELHGFEAVEVGAAAGNEVVDAADRFATGEQSGGDGTANEAGGAGDEIARQRSLLEDGWAADLECAATPEYSALARLP